MISSAVSIALLYRCALGEYTGPLKVPFHRRFSGYTRISNFVIRANPEPGYGQRNQMAVSRTHAIAPA
jgi:hypothetical protein